MATGRQWQGRVDRHPRRRWEFYRHSDHGALAQARSNRHLSLANSFLQELLPCPLRPSCQLNRWPDYATMSVRLASYLPRLSIENGWIDDIDRFSCTKSVDLVVSAYHKACVYKATSLLQARWA